MWLQTILTPWSARTAPHGFQKTHHLKPKEQKLKRRRWRAAWGSWTSWCTIRHIKPKCNRLTSRWCKTPRRGGVELGNFLEFFLSLFEILANSKWKLNWCDLHMINCNLWSVTLELWRFTSVSLLLAVNLVLMFNFCLDLRMNMSGFIEPGR